MQKLDVLRKSERAALKFISAFDSPRLREHTRTLERAVCRLHRRHSHLSRLAFTDPLTGLPNRRAIEAVAGHEVGRGQRNPQPLALGVVDVDRFKQINREHLLLGGDCTLIALAETLRQSLRVSDRVGRIGGDEFLIVAPDTDVAGAGTLAERIRSLVEQTSVERRGQIIRLTVSIGFAVATTESGACLDDLRETAAAALADAKAATDTLSARCECSGPHSSARGIVEIADGTEKGVHHAEPIPRSGRGVGQLVRKGARVGRPGGVLGRRG